MSDDVPMKRCAKCREEKPATHEFFKQDKRAKYGCQSYCRVCENARNRAYNRSPKGRATAKARRRLPEVRDRDNYFRRIRRSKRHDQFRVSWVNHRALKHNAQGTFTEQQIQEQLKRQKCRCYYCKGKFEKRYIYQIDHLTPLSKGGSNDISNIALTCPTCNMSKKDKSPHEFHEGGKLL